MIFNKFKKYWPLKLLLNKKHQTQSFFSNYKFKSWHPVVLLILLAVGYLFLHQKTSQNTIQVEIGSRTIQAEIADSPIEQTKGLMFRKNLADNSGMLFIFSQEGHYPFWMKNTKIPLDIIWISLDKKIVHVEHSVPPCLESPCLSYSSPKPAMYVLETNGGWTIKNDVKIGESVSF